MTNLVTFPGLGLSFEVNRVAFTIGGMNIYWYGVLIATGIVLAILFAFRHCAEFGIDGDSMTDVIVVGVVMAIVCARIYYVAMSPFAYDSIWDMLDIRQGGLAIYGGIIGAVIFGGLACRWRKVPVAAMLDLTGMGFLIGQCIGRWGNFVNQEAFGCNTTLPWGMYSAATEAYLRGSTVTVPAGAVIDPAMPVHPTFLYESLWCLVGFIALRLYMKKRRFNGDIALLYAIWYGAGRFWIEGLRTDSLYLFDWTIAGQPIRVSQALSVVIFVVAVAYLIIRRSRHPDPANLFVTRRLMAEATAQSEQYLADQEADKRDAALLEAVDQAGRTADAEIAAQANQADLSPAPDTDTASEAAPDAQEAPAAAPEEDSKHA